MYMAAQKVDLTTANFNPGMFHERIETTSRTNDVPRDLTPYKGKKNISILEGIQTIYPFSELFFSEENVKWLQSNIRHKIYILSSNKYVISNQDERELMLIMRAIYLQNSNNPEKQEEYTKEILKLNKLVMEYVIPSIISEIEQYSNYIKDISQVATPIPLPIATSIHGTKLYDRGPSDVLGIDTLNAKNY